MQESLSDRLREQALSPVESDVPERWSLNEYRLAVELRAQLEPRWWRRLPVVRDERWRRAR